MPNCVVKSCRNHSRTVGKTQGVTFHRFPHADDVLKNDWIQIIRKCKNEPNWIPSRSSTICSVHFDKNDLYTTKGGHLRVSHNAVPTKFLSGPSQYEGIHPLQLVKVVISGISHEKSLGNEASNSEQQNNSKQSCLNETDNSKQNSLAFQSVASTSGTKERLEPSSQNESSLLQQDLYKLVTPDVDNGLEQPLSTRERRMQYQIKRLNALTQRQKQKIKTLNQKIRRLETRNTSFKGVLKALKEQIKLIQSFPVE